MKTGRYTGNENVIYRGKLDGDFSCSAAAKRDVFGRKAECEWSGGGSPAALGPPVRYRPGEPAPICKDNCGKLCTGYFCNPSPAGTNPDFNPPTTTQPPHEGGHGVGHNGGGNNGGNNGGFPTISPVPDPEAPPGEVCLSSTTTRECNGGLQGQACQTKTKCLSYGQPKPTHLLGLPELSDITGPTSVSGASCVKTATWTIVGGPKGDATITSSGCATWEFPKPTSAPPAPAPGPKRPCIIMRVFQNHCPFPNPIIRVQV
jgi:hypothetical protein